MNSSKAIRVLQHCMEQNEDTEISFDNFNGIKRTIENNKDKILSMMGGKSIIEKEEAVDIQINDEVKDLGYSQYLRILIEIPHFKNLYVLRRFLRDCGAIAFYDNKTTEELSYKITVESGKEEVVRIPQGMKITKALKFFIGGNTKLLNFLQTKYSQIINTKSISGKLGITCDPMDFLTMSVNNNNWRSCMSLDGEYSAGTLSYAADKHTLMVYLRSDKEDEQLPLLPKDVSWNSKKWRCLFYFDKSYNLLISTKQYPFTSTSLMEEATRFIQKELGLQNYEYKQIDSIYDYDVLLNSEGLIFNDLEANNSNIILHSLISKDYKGEQLSITPGKDVLCPICNKNHIDYGGSFICSECACRSICENCGNSIGEDDENYYVDGSYICEDCMNECCVVCDCCYEAFWSDGDDIIYTEEGMAYCADCYNECID